MKWGRRIRLPRSRLRLLVGRRCACPTLQATRMLWRKAGRVGPARAASAGPPRAAQSGRNWRSIDAVRRRLLVGRRCACPSRF
jgi:hypothetical protein